MKGLQFEEPQFTFTEAEYLDPEKIDTIEDCNLEPDQILIMECKESQRPWVIKNPHFPMEGKCESCYQYKILTHPCECKKVL